MPTTTLSGQPIARGYSHAIRVTVATDGDDAVFPAGCRLMAQFREFAGAPAVQATLSTDNGKIVRIDDDTIRLDLSAADTADMQGQTVTDLVRTDLSPDAWLGIQLRFEVAQPATMTGGDA